MKNEVTTAIILETRKLSKDGVFPVKLRVTYLRERVYYTIKDEFGSTIAMSESDFQKAMGRNARGEFKEMGIYLNKQESHARETISKILPNFSFAAFKQKYFSTVEDESDLFSCLSNAVEKLKDEGRISTSIAYRCTLRSLQSFHTKKTLPFTEVDISFLNKYEKWMLKEGNSLTTTGIYLRNVRTMFNRNQSLSKEFYPFGEQKYQIPGGRNIKKALTQKEVGLIANYPVIEGSSEHKYRDYWLFSYLCNGINVKDIAFLKYGRVSGDVITFIRAKTAREKKQSPRPITIVITKQIGRIIDRWGNKPGAPATYIFPILEAGLTPQQQYVKVQQVTKMINKYIGEIGDAIGLPHITSYTARHSFATVLKRSGASVEFISESLGHSNIATTENYLADFEIEEKKKWAEKLGDF